MIEALQFDFMRNALIAGLLASVICGIMGTLVVVNRIVFLSGGIAQIRGVRIKSLYFLMIVMLTVGIVMIIQVVGLILVIALLTLPAAVANHHAHRLGRMMISATLLTAALTAGGLFLGYGPDLPSGAVTILLAGFLFIVSSIFRRRSVLLDRLDQRRFPSPP